MEHREDTTRETKRLKKTVTTMSIRPPKEELFEFVRPGDMKDLGNNWKVRAKHRGRFTNSGDLISNDEGDDGFLEMTYCGGLKVEEGVDLLPNVKLGDTLCKKFHTHNSSWWIPLQSMYDKSHGHYDDVKQCFVVGVDVDFRSSCKHLKDAFFVILKDVFKVTGPTSFASLFGRHTEEEESVAFVVQKEEFEVHKFVLRCRSEPLWQAAEGRASGTRIELDGVDPKIFKAIIDHMYLRADPPDLDSDRHMAEALICAADRFGFPDLKLFVQYKLCRWHLTTKSAADLLVLAHRTSSTLLFDEAINLCADFPVFVSKSRSWKGSILMNPDIMNEILVYSKHRRRDIERVTKDDVDELSVVSLLKFLRANGRDVDGTRETLVKRLKSTFT